MITNKVDEFGILLETGCQTIFMNDALLVQLTASLNNLLTKTNAAEIGIQFDEIAEQLRILNIKIQISEIKIRQPDLELYFTLERKNIAYTEGDDSEADRLKARIIQLLAEKKTLDSDRLFPSKGNFYYQGGIIQGTLCSLVKNEGILLQLLHAYDLRV